MKIADATHAPSLAELIEHFDFKSATKVYALLDWRWAGSKRSPTAKELKDLANRLSKDILWLIKDDPTQGYYHMSSGGLSLTARREQEGWGYSLCFEAISSSAYLLDEGWHPSSQEGGEQ